MASTTRRTAAEPEVEETPVEVADEAPARQGRDRSIPRMSEGVRYELEVNGFAVDPGTGEMLGVTDSGEVKVVPRDKVPAFVKRRTAQLAKDREPAVVTGPALPQER